MLLSADSNRIEQQKLGDVIPGWPNPNSAHIRRLTDRTGIIQHARYAVPDYHHGYCLDDNSRALLLTTLAYGHWPEDEVITLATTYLSYIQFMQLENGKFRNFLSYDRRFLDLEGTDDSFGRTIWALGAFQKMGRVAPLAGHVRLSEELLSKALPHCTALKSVRGIAYSLLGLVHWHEVAADRDVFETIQILSEQLATDYRLCTAKEDGWHWFEDILAYDNAILPYSLMRAADVCPTTEISPAWQAAEFLDGLLFENGVLSSIGNQAWFRRGGHRSVFGQQPLEVPALILMYHHMYTLTGQNRYQRRAIQTMQWFFGKNEKNLRLYDPATGGCCDGLENHGVNLNQGAESTLSFWMAYFSLLQFSIPAR